MNYDLTTPCELDALRDWFAGQALANVYTHHDLQPDKVATWAYQIAAAIMAAAEAAGRKA